MSGPRRNPLAALMSPGPSLETEDDEVGRRPSTCWRRCVRAVALRSLNICADKSGCKLCSRRALCCAGL